MSARARRWAEHRAAAADGAHGGDRTRAADQRRSGTLSGTLSGALSKALRTALGRAHSVACSLARTLARRDPRTLGAALAAALIGFSGVAQAGRSCRDKPPQATPVLRGLDLAQRTAQALEASGARVAVLARAGQDLGRYGLRWSHLGFAYRSEAADGTPRWQVVHKLNACGTAQADLYRQGLGEFFLDDLFEAAAAYQLPSAALQAQLLPLLRDNARIARLHHAPYSMVAYPWAQRYQQSNQWALETLALAAEPLVSGRESAQAWLRLQGYRPSVLHIDALTRLGARVGMANVAFDDHPSAQRFADRIETVTVDSVFVWLQRAGLGGGVSIVR